MADFTQSQIEDAKRRVQNMRNMTKNVSKGSSTQSPSNENHSSDKNNNTDNNYDTSHNNQNNSSTPFSIDRIFKSLGLGGNDEDNKGSGLILALILILSYEKSDNMLILALLYILL